MIDTDFTFVLTDGTEIDVVYPDRVGREYDIPWLTVRSQPGAIREWNIDVHESLRKPEPYNPRFVIGMWGTSYSSEEGVKKRIPYSKVVRIHDLTPELQAKSDEYSRQEEEKRDIENLRARMVYGVEFDALVRRVEELERCKVYRSSL